MPRSTGKPATTPADASAGPKKAPARKAAAKTPAAKTSAAKTSAAKTPAAKKPATKQADSKTTADTQPNGHHATAKPRSRSASAALAVKPDEKAWTAKEVAEVRAELESDLQRLMVELRVVEQELAGLMRDAGDGAGNDQADVGSTTFERDHEMSLANNARDMLAQTEHALARIDDGSYGSCELCGAPIGKMRLMAFPRATLCMSCKQREERR